MDNKKIKQLFADNFPEEYLDLCGRSAQVVVHYPEFFIKNEFEEKHKIYNLYVKFLLNSGRIIGVEGARTTFTEREIFAGYTHSHIGSYKPLGSYKDFCKGSEFSEMIDDFNRARTEEQKESRLLIIINFLDTYVSTESIKGGPYIKMKSLYFQSESTMSYMLNINDLTTEQKKYIVDNIRITSDGRAKFDFFVNAENNVNTFLVPSDKIKDLNITGYGFKEISKPILKVRIEELRFKNKKINPEIIKEDNFIEIESSVMLPCTKLNAHNLVSYVNNTFQNLIIKFLNN